MPQTQDRQVVAEAQEIIHTKTEDPTAAAARRGMSYTRLLRAIQRGEVDAVQWGPRGEMRVWLDGPAPESDPLSPSSGRCGTCPG
jgi:hypothetical protein